MGDEQGPPGSEAVTNGEPFSLISGKDRVSKGLEDPPSVEKLLKGLMGLSSELFRQLPKSGLKPKLTLGGLGGSRVLLELGVVVDVAVESMGRAGRGGLVRGAGGGVGGS